MTFGDKLSKLRKENNYTQEQLSELLGVSRQAISRWESGMAYPETEKIIRLSELYNVSLDYLLKDNVQEQNDNISQDNISEKDTKSIENSNEKVINVSFRMQNLYFERKSEKMINGMPLWHINMGLGRTAKGIFAVGFKAKGIVSVGLFSMGLVSLGLFSLGLLSIGLFAIGLIAAGVFSAGVVAFGAICFGVFAVGAIAVGEFSIGALAIGHYFAYGDNARAMIALGATEAAGSVYQYVGDLSEVDKQSIIKLLYENVPIYYKWFIK